MPHSTIARSVHPWPRKEGDECKNVYRVDRRTLLHVRVYSRARRRSLTYATIPHHNRWTHTTYAGHVLTLHDLGAPCTKYVRTYVFSAREPDEETPSPSNPPSPRATVVPPPDTIQYVLSLECRARDVFAGWGITHHRSEAAEARNVGGGEGPTPHPKELASLKAHGAFSEVRSRCWTFGFVSYVSTC